MKHRSEGATALLGMPRVVVGAHLELDGEIRHVETPPRSSWGAAGVYACSGHKLVTGHAAQAGTHRCGMDYVSRRMRS